MSIPDSISHPPPSPKTDKTEQKFRGWHKFSFSRWLGREEHLGEDQKQNEEETRPGLGRRLSRKVIPGLPRPATFRRQNSERRERLAPVEPSIVERRTASVERRRALSARPASPPPIPVPKLSAPEVRNVNHTYSPFTHDSSITGPSPTPIQPLDVPSAAPPTPAPPPTPPDTKSIMSEESFDEQLDEQIKAELEDRWILNLSMCFRDRSPREKFFVTYAEVPNRWRRVTVSCDYRDKPPDSLERDLQALQYQRDKSARIYEAIRMSLPEIQFYDTVTNLKLETTDDDRLHVHVTEDTNEIIQYPSIRTVQHLQCLKVSESDVHFEAHMSGFVYKVKVDGQIIIKKEIPGPDCVDEFLYEVNALYALLGTDSVIQLKGLVIDAGNTVVKGLLIGFAEQGSLIDLLYDMKGQLTWARREKWAKQVMYGLSKIHEAGFVQGDFTLSNIVIDERDRANIIDINRRGCPVGWEPPEISELIKSGQRISMYIGVKSDLFQLGMVLWALAEEVDEPERELRPLLKYMTQKNTPQYYHDLVAICLSDDPKKRLSAQDLLPLFPDLVDEDLAPPLGRRHSVSVPSETQYIDPAQAVEREDLDLHGQNFENREFSTGSRTYIDRHDSIDLPFDGPGSYVVSHRPRKPLSNPSPLSFRAPSREVSSGHQDDEEPQIIAISPTGENRWEEIEVDGNPYLVQKGSFNFDEGNGKGSRRGRSRLRRADSELGLGTRTTLSIDHVDSGLADMDHAVAGVGGHEALKYSSPTDRVSKEMDVDPHDRENSAKECSLVAEKEEETGPKYSEINDLSNASPVNEMSKEATLDFGGYFTSEDVSPLKKRVERMDIRTNRAGAK
ncbi:hypothetical protein MMC06_005725 [Schaereria dolodes]|nr:hypothetical protein [Schaereria dolodes]